MIVLQPLHNPYFVKFIVYFNENQDFFECHEVLEEYWKSLPGRTKDHLLTAYILLSTGLYHWRRDNRVGGLKSLQKAYEKLANATDDDFKAGIDFDDLCHNVQRAISDLENEEPFNPFTIQTSIELKKLADDMKTTMDLLPSRSDAVIHKHMLRDRSDILRKRDEKKKGRKY